MVLTLACLCYAIVGFSQSKRGNIGIFGNGVGLDFNVEPPQVIIPVPPSPDHRFGDCFEGSASICNTDGDLLFYTNGLTVWNRNHSIMPNGDLILGYHAVNVTTTTQCLIVPVPKDPFQYYIITAEYQGGNLDYTLVDMRLNHGLGDVVFKDSLIYPHTTEKMCVIKHANGQALWLVTHQMGSNHFRANLIDEDGLHLNFIESAVGKVHVDNIEPSIGSNAIGYLKASHNGSHIACAVSGAMGTLEYFSFDKATGMVSDPRLLLDNPARLCYGVEFSPDDSKLYISHISPGEVFQFDLAAGTDAQIVASKTLLADNAVGALQLGPDNKIYFACSTMDPVSAESLSIISEPNLPGILCEVQKHAIHLRGKVVYAGLPEFFYNPVDPEIAYSGYCTGNEIRFELINIIQFTHVVWNFGDPGSGAENTSTSPTPRHTYANPGRYKLHVDVTFSDGSVFSYNQPISILPMPSFELGRDTMLCPQQSITLAPQSLPPVADYLWNDGSTEPVRTIDQPGKYWVSLSNGCIATDTINIGFLPIPDLSLPDTALCFDQVLDIALPDDFEYYWRNDGSTGNEKTITDPGKYHVTASNRCGSDKDEFTVSIVPRIHVHFPAADTVLCVGQEMKLEVSVPGGSYQWHDGSTGTTFNITGQGMYSVRVTNGCEWVADSIKVSYAPDGPFFIPNVITPNGDERNEYFKLDEMLTDAALTVYDRWGKEVYATPHYKNDWNARGVHPGVYYYIVRDACAGKAFKGVISVVE